MGRKSLGWPSGGPVMRRWVLFDGDAHEHLQQKVQPQVGWRLTGCGQLRQYRDKVLRTSRPSNPCPECVALEVELALQGAR